MNTSQRYIIRTFPVLLFIYCLQSHEQIALVHVLILTHVTPIFAELSYNCVDKLTIFLTTQPVK